MNDPQLGGETHATPLSRARRHAWRWSGEFAPRRRLLRNSYAVGALPRSRSLSRLCVVTAGRTGSELLCDLLAGHPAIHCDFEILRQGPAFPRAMLRGRARLAAVRSADAYVFKLAMSHLEFPRRVLHPRLLFDDLAADGFRFVHLSRRDLLRQAISFLRAKESGTFHSRVAPLSQSAAQRIDPVALIAAMHWLEAREALAETQLLGLPVRRLWYEDDLQEPSARETTLDCLFRDLGVTPYRSGSSLRKLTPSSLRDAVSNYDEVVASLRATRYGAFVGEDEPEALSEV